MTVCGSWLNILNEYFSKDNCIVLNKDSNFSRAGPLYKTFHKRLEMTKEKRFFPYLVIKSFSSDFFDLYQFSRFLELIGDEVKFLTIPHMPNHYKNLFDENIYAKMPNLKSLEVADESLLGGLTFPKGLQTIKVQSRIIQLGQLNKIQKIKTIHTLTAHSIKIYNNSFESFLSFIEPSFKTLLKRIVGSDPDTSIVMQSSYNYCGTTKMKPDDITSMSFENGPPASLTPSIVGQFSNLKKLCFNSFSTPGPVITTKQVRYSGITSLTFFGVNVQPFPHFDKLLQSFPDLESLCIDGIKLEANHFPLICQCMPKLKQLILVNGTAHSEVCLLGILLNQVDD